jgi:hypothetical protein
MKETAMRRVLTLLVALPLLAALFPTAALGAPPERFTDTQTIVVCEPLVDDDGIVFTFVQVSERFGSFAALAFFAPGTSPETDPPTLISTDAVVTLSPDGTALTVIYDLVEFDPTTEPPFGDFVGTALLDVTLTPIGEPEAFSDRFRDGNRWVTIEGTRQLLAVEGDLTLPGDVVFDASGCNAFTETITVFATNPAAFIQRFDETSLSCHWETAAGTVDLFAFSDGFFAFSDLFVVDTSGEYFGSTEAVLTTTEYSAEFQLFDATDPQPEEPLGSASAAATLTATGERIRFIDRQPFFMFKFIGEVLSVDGELTLETPAGAQMLTMDDESCTAQTGRVMFQEVSPAGPKAKNDTPESAEPLDIGDSVRVSTVGLALEPEAPCTATFPDGVTVEVPFGSTAWWTFVGTGEEVTIDTAGSNFDTVVGVYVLEDGELVQVACVDDVFEPEFSLQARVTIDTEPGVTYYIQAGGFAGDTGILQLSLQ